MSARWQSYLPSANWTRFAVAPALVFIATSIDRNYQTDFWHHLARGQIMANSGALLDHDLFTYTVPGKTFQDTNWLTQLLYARLYAWGGLELVQLANSATLALMMSLVVWLCRRGSGSLLVAALVGVFTFFGLWQLLIIRPQTFSLLLFVLLYAALEMAERQRWWLICAPLIMALWTNLHGGFPIGLVLIGSVTFAVTLRTQCVSMLDGRAVFARISETCRHDWAWLLCLASSVLATLVNPYGWRVYQYVGVTSTAAAGRSIDEWLPPGLDLLTGKVFAVSIVLVVVLFALPARRPSVKQICLVVCFLPFACGSVRMVAWWLLATAPTIATLLAANLPRKLVAEETEPPSLATGVAFLAILVAVIVSAPMLERFNPVFRYVRDPHRTEGDLEAVAEWLPPEHGRVFSRFAWNEYLGWRLRPHYQVFMDGRLEIFPTEVWAAYEAITRGRADWEEILDRCQVDFLILDGTSGYHRALVPQVQRSSKWEHEPAFASGDVIVFRRRASTARENGLRGSVPQAVGFVQGGSANRR